MSRQQIRRQDLIAVFEAKAESPPSKQNELLMSISNAKNRSI
jgi:hypothetical protein